MLEAMFINLDKNKVVWFDGDEVDLLHASFWTLEVLSTWWGGNMLYDSGQ